MPQLSFHSPLGALTVSEEDGAIVAVDWGWGRDQTHTPLLDAARAHLLALFDGKPPATELALAPAGTPFRQRVWAAMQRIPPGETRTYGQLAAELGSSARAIGGACGANPIPILIPCHRVVGASGLGGFSAADGAPTKRYLLALDARIAASAA